MVAKEVYRIIAVWQHRGADRPHLRLATPAACLRRFPSARPSRCRAAPAATGAAAAGARGRRPPRPQPRRSRATAAAERKQCERSTGRYAGGATLCRSRPGRTADRRQRHSGAGVRDRRRRSAPSPVPVSLSEVPPRAAAALPPAQSGPPASDRGGRVRRCSSAAVGARHVRSRQSRPDGCSARARRHSGAAVGARHITCRRPDRCGYRDRAG